MKAQNSILKLKIRQEIYNYILENPSSYLREISRNMNIPKTTLKYHLDYLEKHNLITPKLEDKYKRYYVKDKLGQREKELLNLLRQEVPRNIILYLIFHIVCSQIELSKALGKHPSTISFHLKKLRDLEIIQTAFIEERNIIIDEPVVIERNKKSSEIIYIFSDEEFFYIIYNLLIVSKKSLPDKDMIEDLLLFIDDLASLDESNKRLKIKSSTYKKLNNPDRAIDELLEFVLEVLPHPYHV